VSKRTIDNWFNEVNPIPKMAAKLIARLAAEMTSTVPKYTPEQFAKIQEAMRRQGYDSIEEWMVAASIRVAEEATGGEE